MDALQGDLLPERLQRRDRELQSERQRKRQDRESEDSNRIAVDHFHGQFAKKRAEIESALNELTLGVTDSSLVPTTLEGISKDIQSLQKYVSSSTMFLCLHDVRKSQESIQDLQRRLQDLEGKLLPKKKFGFKVRKAHAKEVLLPRIKDQVDSGTALTKILTEDDCGIKNKVNETLVMRGNSISGKNVVLSNICGCTVKLMGSPSTLHMTRVHNCTILTGPVTTSIFIEDCSDCKFVLACQQLRIHDTHDCDFYLHVTSRVIIEDTDSVRVAPYDWSYEGIEQDLISVGWDLQKNHWNSVDDFNWLSSDSPSPNWRVLEEADRVCHRNGTEVI